MNSYRLPVGKRKKGIALIATLFAVTVVLILGVSFLILSISETRTTRAEKESVMALQLANAGAEMMMNYMGLNHSNFGDSDSKPIWVIEDQDTGLPYKLVEYENPSDPVVLREGNNVTEDFRFNIEREWNDDQKSYIYSVTISPDRVLDPESTYFGRIRLKVTQARFMLGQPQQFIINSIGRVYRDTDKMKDDENDMTAVATRQIEVRVREKAVIDNLMFMQNHRAYDLVGNGVAPPNANDGTNNASGIPANFIAHGPVVIDGNSDFAYETAGNLQFFSTSGVQFLGEVSINSDANVYPSGTTQQDIDDMFKNGILTEQPSVGLPHKDGYLNADLDGNGALSTSEQGYASVLAQDYSGSHPITNESYVKAYFRCGDNDGLPTAPGLVGHSVAPNPEIWNGDYGVDPTNPNDNMTLNRPADVEFDGSLAHKEPGFATFLVELYEQNGVGKLTLKKRTAYTNQTVTLLSGASLSQFKNGIIFLEGGNVDVRGTCNGQITIVTSESPFRDAYGFQVKVAGNATPLTQYSSIEQNKAAYPNDPGMWIPGKIANATIEWVKPMYSKTDNYGGTDPNADYIYLPYDDPRLPVRVDPATGNTTGEFPREGPYKIGGRWVWPSDPLIRETITNVTDGASGKPTGLFRDMEHEGNGIIGNDIDYGNGSANALGLIAQNYILLNADNVTANHPVMNLRAVLMSFEHSVQFDDVNLARKSTWVSQANMNGTFNFIGAIVSQYADVEGKIDGTGYTNQDLAWDKNLETVMPPNFPHWDVTQLSNKTVMEYVILSYQDKGSLKVQ